MRNQRGDVTLLCCMILLALSGLLTLAGLELQRNFELLQKRTNLFLCVKETKGELNHYMFFMGRTNWLLKNISRAQIVAVFIPTLWPYVGNAEQLKKIVKGLQLGSLTLYYNKVLELKNQGCPLDPQILLNPYVLGKDFGFSRTMEGAAKLRSKKWTYYFLDKPYFLSLKVDATGAESLMPKMSYRAEEKLGKLSSLLSSL